MPVAGLSEVGARGVELGSGGGRGPRHHAGGAERAEPGGAGLGLLDHPDGGRKRHARPVPMTGALAMMAGVGVSAMFGLHLGTTPMGGIVAVIHAFEDQSGNGQHGLSARQRLTIDAIIALAFITVAGSVINSFDAAGGVALGLGVLAGPFTIVNHLAVTNAYNMIHGLDR